MTAPHQRSARSGAGLRTLRAAVFAAVCVVLAAAGHGIASCATVPLWTLGAGFLAVFAVAAALAGRERALPGIVALLTLGQTVLHTLFGLGLRTGTTGTGSSMGAMAPGMPMSDAALVARAARLVCGTAAAAISPAQAMKILADARIDTGMTGMTSSMHHASDAVPTAAGTPMPVLPSLPMLLGHVLAAVAAGWVLRHGDLALLRLMRLSAQGVTEAALVRSLRAALTLVRALRTGLPGAPEIACTPHTALLAPLAPRTTALQHTVVRRGPPASTAFTLVA
uniref:Integral membrane protein n=1 Tax=Streptomyces sp. NBC_01393 TaxID=2903851 RepID=A0AAU3I1U1_9ACTN